MEVEGEVGGGGGWEKGEGGGGEGVERSREKGGWKDGRGGCGKDEEADPTYIISNTRSLDISPQNGEITLERETR